MIFHVTDEETHLLSQQESLNGIQLQLDIATLSQLPGGILISFTARLALSVPCHCLGVTYTFTSLYGNEASLGKSIASFRNEN